MIRLYSKSESIKTWSRIVLISGVILLVALSGCAGTGEIDGSDCPSIPFASFGDEYSYDAEGLVGTLSSIFLVDWSVVHPDGKTTAEAPEGSRIEVKIGDQPVPRMGIYGEKTDALQVTYWWTHPQYGGPLAVHDEWIDLGTGQLVQNNHRVLDGPGKYESDGHDDWRHAMQFSRVGFPPIYWSSAFWGKELQLGKSGTISSPNLTPAWIKNANGTLEDLAWGEMTYEITNVELESGGHCTFEVNIKPKDSIWGRGLSENGKKVVFSTSQALPTQLTYTYADGDKVSTMELENATRSEGEHIPYFQEKASFSNRTLETAKLKNGFIKDESGIFPTSYTQAYEAMQADESFHEWLEDHPDAKPTQVGHFMGDPESDPMSSAVSYLYSNPTSRAIDAWEVVWRDPDGAEIAVDAVRTESPPLDLPNEEIEIHLRDIETTHKYPTYAPDEEWVTLGEIARLGEDIYDEPIEVVVCYMYLNRCADIGTHNSTDRAHYEFGGSGSGVVGMGVWLNEGLVLSLAARSDDALGSPVQ